MRGEKKENENIRFRTFLKEHADEKVLDQQFIRFHKEVFADYDCSRCRNCCKMYHGSIPAEDINKDAAFLGISEGQFIDYFLRQDELTLEYETKHKPCDFLEEDGTCKLKENRPDNCKKYPYTNEPERLESMYSVLEAVSVCPVAFEILERLKVEYGFKR